VLAFAFLGDERDKRCTINIYRVAHLWSENNVYGYYNNIIIMAVVACGVLFNSMRGSYVQAAAAS
jgi:hypothetical protein